MSRSKSLENAAFLGVRVPEALLERLDVVAEDLRRSRPGTSATRSDAVRAALHVGLAALEARGR